MSEENEERFKNYYKLPIKALELMNWLCTTRFYKNTYLKRKEGYQNIKENWKFCDFSVIEGTLEDPKIIKIGEIPHYQYEHEKSLVINFKSIENCYLIRGFATGLYASKVISNIFPIPKYMKEGLKELLNKE